MLQSQNQRRILDELVARGVHVSDIFTLTYDFPNVTSSNT